MAAPLAFGSLLVREALTASGEPAISGAGGLQWQRPFGADYCVIVVESQSNMLNNIEYIYCTNTQYDCAHSEQIGARRFVVVFGGATIENLNLFSLTFYPNKHVEALNYANERKRHS